jgi:hypothetical protein
VGGIFRYRRGFDLSISQRQENLMPYAKHPRFPLGELVTTPGALDLLDRAGINATALLARHQHGDWGIASAAEIARNRKALKKRQGFTSVFEVGDRREKLLIVTSADWGTTTLLLPHEAAEMQRKVLIQSFHPSIQIGWTLSAANSNPNMPLHCRQGTWDGACGQHCLGMAMGLLGEVRDVRSLSARRKGLARRLWDSLPANYFTGTSLMDLVVMAKSLLRRHVITECIGSHHECLAFTQASVREGHLVIAGWCSHRNRAHHWTLIVGIEGMQTGTRFLPHALLALDPGTNAPTLCGYNARLDLCPASGSRYRKHLRYVTADGQNWTVKLNAAVTIGERD